MQQEGPLGRLEQHRPSRGKEARGIQVCLLMMPTVRVMMTAVTAERELMLCQAQCHTRYTRMGHS